VPQADRPAARVRFGVAGDGRCLLVMGGSQGARSINLAAVEAFAEASDAGGRDFHVLHLSGSRDHAELAARLASAPHPGRYTLIEYEPDLGDVLAACDLVVARAGGSIFEVTAAGRPAILVPYPHATADHQTANAAWMVDAGAAEKVEDAKLSAGLLARRVADLLGDEERLAAMSRASAALARPDAARRIADEVLAAAAADASGALYAVHDHKGRTGT
jgi:UDP-N-acetylglucosamine--N-acetylmuramyl-(pentapeptide) pyrophosphoryl-undecaprenol N-acetylglucosamine transferase